MSILKRDYLDSKDLKILNSNLLRSLKKKKRRYRRVLIIDDVITTGSSIHALSQALKQLGCTSIHASCLAAASSTSY